MYENCIYEGEHHFCWANNRLFTFVMFPPALGSSTNLLLLHVSFHQPTAMHLALQCTLKSVVFWNWLTWQKNFKTKLTYIFLQHWQKPLSLLMSTLTLLHFDYSFLSQSKVLLDKFDPLFF